jgi:hypothetical protein
MKKRTLSRTNTRTLARCRGTDHVASSAIVGGVPVENDDDEDDDDGVIELEDDKEADGDYGSDEDGNDDDFSDEDDIYTVEKILDKKVRADVCGSCTTRFSDKQLSRALIDTLRLTH